MLNVQRPNNDDDIKQAKDYGSPLVDAGFICVAQGTDTQGGNVYPPSGYTPQAGDVVVIQSYPGSNPSGHMAMYDGDDWISDFVQIDMWGGKGRRAYARNIQVQIIVFFIFLYPQF